MVAAVVDREVIRARKDERSALAELLRVVDSEVLESEHRSALLGPNGEVIALPEAIYRVLRRAAQVLEQGDGVVVISQHHEFTTREAADLLNVSRQYVVELCDAGLLPCTKAGSHRRIRSTDLLAFKKRRDAERRARLRRVTRLSQQLGMYDAPPPEED